MGYTCCLLLHAKEFGASRLGKLVGMAIRLVGSGDDSSSLIGSVVREFIFSPLDWEYKILIIKYVVAYLEKHDEIHASKLYSFINNLNIYLHDGPPINYELNEKEKKIKQIIMQYIFSQVPENYDKQLSSYLLGYISGTCASARAYSMCELKGSYFIFEKLLILDIYEEKAKEVLNLILSLKETKNEEYVQAFQDGFEDYFLLSHDKTPKLSLLRYFTQQKNDF